MKVNKKQVLILAIVFVFVSISAVPAYAVGNPSGDVGSPVGMFMGASPYGENSSAEALGPGTARHYKAGDGVRVTIYTYDADFRRQEGRV